MKSANEAFLDSGGGTTVSILAIHGSDAVSYHVGDSTLLIVGESGQVKLETIPHSTVGRALANREIDEKTAMHHPMRHIVHNMIGMRDGQKELENYKLKLILKHKPEGNKILEIGCGQGQFLKSLPSTFQKFGVEIHDKGYHYVQKNYPEINITSRNIGVFCG